MTEYILITGASTGIGKACALHLAERGYHVFGAVRKQTDADTLQTEGNGNITPVMIDVTDQEQIISAVETITKIVGETGLKALVNNAGIPVPGPLEALPIDGFRYQMEVNVTGQLAVTQAFLPLLRQSKTPATIINMSSISGRIATTMVGAYTASKFALEAMNDVFRVELRPWNIRVVSVEPGKIATPIWEKTLKSGLKMFDGIPEEKTDLYQPLIDHRIRITKPNQGIPAVEVAMVVEEAIASPRPKARYLVGKDAKTAVWIARLPTRIRDWLLAKSLPKYGPDIE